MSPEECEARNGWFHEEFGDCSEVRPLLSRPSHLLINDFARTCTHLTVSRDKITLHTETYCIALTAAMGNLMNWLVEWFQYTLEV